MRAVAAISFLILIFSCGHSPENVTVEVTPPPVDSLEPTPPSLPQDFPSFIKILNISNINQYIDPKNGLWIVESFGAMPSMRNTFKVDSGFPLDFSAIKNEELPAVACDSKSIWTKEGCYMEEVNRFKVKKIWTFCGLTKEQEKKIAGLAENVSWTIINTASHARYYFSLIEGKWYLSFVNLVSPCEV